MRFSVRLFPNGYRAVVTDTNGHIVAVAIEPRRNRNACAIDAQAFIKAVQA